MVLSGVGGGEVPRHCDVEIEQRSITPFTTPP